MKFYLFGSLIITAYAMHSVGALASVATIKESWASQKSAAGTAKIRFLKMTMTIRESELSAQQVAELVSGLTSDPGEELMAELVHKLHPELEKRFNEHDQSKQAWSLWDERTLFSDGFSERSTGENDEHLTVQGLHLVHSMLSRNVDCYEAGQCPYFYYSLNWLLCVPPMKVLEEVHSSDSSQGKLHLVLGDGDRLVLDEESHLPVYEELVNGAGEVTKATYYREPTGYPGGITIPAVKIQVGFQRGKASNVMVTAILDAEFNTEIEESNFILPLEKGAVLTDLRHGDRHSRRSKIAVANAVEYFEVSETVPKQLAPVVMLQGFNWKGFLLITNGIFLMVLGFIVWKKAK